MELSLIENKYRCVEYQINDDKLLVKEIGYSFNNESIILLENLTSERTKFTQRNSTILLMVILFAFFGLIVLTSRVYGIEVGYGAELFWAIISITFFMFYWNSKRTLTRLNTTIGNPLTFKHSTKDQSKVEYFIDKLIERRNELMLNKYGTLNRRLNYESQYQNWVYLRSAKVITQEQLKHNINKLDVIFNNFENKIGFNTNDN